MAYFDSLLQFSLAQAITTTANATNLYDVTGAGSGNAPAMIGPNGVNTGIGIDIGAGDGMAIPEVQATVTTAGTGAGTITISLQSAPDNGSYSPGTYTTIYQSAAFVGTSLTVGSVLTFQVPPNPPGVTTLPRFYRLVYTVASTATASFTTNLLLNAPTVKNVTLHGNNYVSV